MIVNSQTEQFYISIDGDDIGDKVQEAITGKGVPEAMKISKEIDKAQFGIADMIKELNGELIFQGGDNTFAQIPKTDLGTLHKFIDIYKENTGHTATVGVGETPLEANMAFTLGKNTGKNKVVIWDKSLEPYWNKVVEFLQKLDKKIEEVKQEYPLEFKSYIESEEIYLEAYRRMADEEWQIGYIMDLDIGDTFVFMADPEKIHTVKNIDRIRGVLETVDQFFKKNKLDYDLHKDAKIFYMKGTRVYSKLHIKADEEPITSEYRIYPDIYNIDYWKDGYYEIFKDDTFLAKGQYDNLITLAYNQLPEVKLKHCLYQDLMGWYKKAVKPKSLAIDFDGVIAENNFPEIGKMIEGTKESIDKLRDEGWRIIIYSARISSGQEEQYPLIEQFLKDNDINYDLIAIGSKPIADIYIDDRAIRFTDWKATIEDINKLEKVSNLMLVKSDIEELQFTDADKDKVKDTVYKWLLDKGFYAENIRDIKVIGFMVNHINEITARVIFSKDISKEQIENLNEYYKTDKIKVGIIDRVFKVDLELSGENLITSSEKEQETIEKLKEELYEDVLTKVYNRRYLEDNKEKLLKDFSHIILIDIDYFKEVNDEYGHDTGDRILVGVTKIIKNVISEKEPLIRYGGEEFIVFDGFDIAETIRKTVEDTTGDTEIPITVSIGVASVDKDNWDKTFIFADQALYKSKEKGRNRVTVWSEDISNGNGHHDGNSDIYQEEVDKFTSPEPSQHYASEPLEEYKKKRDFEKTPEPKPEIKDMKENIFVIQEHWTYK